MTTRRRPWMSLADRRRWRSARTLADLGQLMAGWLEGSIASQPGYQPNWGPDDETADLIPTLAAANRAGYLTTSSQPGLEAWGADGNWWRQRAAVDGHVTDRVLLRSLLTAADDAGLYVEMQDWMPERHTSGIAVTDVDHEPYTWFGGHLTYRDLRCIWPGLHREAFHEVATSVHLTLVSPEWGTHGQVWDVLDQAVAEAAALQAETPGPVNELCACTDVTPCPGDCGAWVPPSVPLCTACAQATTPPRRTHP